MTETTRTYTTLDDLYTHEIADALNGVEENFDTDGFLHELRERDLIIWTGTGFALVIDDEGNTPGFWELVEDFDRQAQTAPVELFNGSPRLKPGDFNLKLHPKPRKEVPNV